MKKIYYFSETKIKYIQVQYFKSTLSLILFSLLLPMFFIISDYLFPSKNNLLTAESISQASGTVSVQKQLNEILSRYKTLEKEFKNLLRENDDLRIAANLQPITEERKLGTGGGLDFDILKNFNNESVDLDDISELLENFTTKIEFEKTQYKQISTKLKQNNSLYESIPAIKPCNGRLAHSGFGMRFHPILKSRRMHNGIDIVTYSGTPVHAAGKGVISFTGRRGGYGLAVEINHGFGYRSIYAHLSKINVKPGQPVKRGDLIAQSGNTGLSTGPHLHYEVQHNGVKMDPEDFFFSDLSLFDK